MLSVGVRKALARRTTYHNIDRSKIIKNILIVDIMHIFIKVPDVWMVTSICLSSVRVFFCSSDHTHLTSTLKSIAKATSACKQVNYSIYCPPHPSKGYKL